MILVINASLKYTGGGLQVALSFIHECINFPMNIYHVFVSGNLSVQIERKKFPENFIFYDIPNLKFHQYNAYLSKIEKRINPDIVFSIFGPVYWKPSVKHVVGYAMGHYIYDDSPYWSIASVKERILFKIKKQIHLYYLNRDVSVFVCETDDVNERISSLFPLKKIYTVSNTCSSVFFDNLLRVKFLKLPVQNMFRFLTICSYYPHKNLILIKYIVDELRKLKRDGCVQFILTITPIEYDVLFGSDYKDCIFTVGTTPVDECPSLYNECNAMFLPTLLECFSASYPEAMSMSKPILTSDLGFARTVCGDAALYFNPMSAQDAVGKIISLLDDELLYSDLVSRGQLRIKQFPTAYDRAKMYLDICKSNI